MVLAAPVAHGAAEAALEKRLQVGEIGVSTGLRYHLDRTVRCRKELLHGVELLARNRLVDRLAAELLESEVRKSARNASGVNSLGIWKSRVCQFGCIRVKWNTPERMSRPADPDILRTIATLLMRFIAEKNTITLARKSTKDATPHYGVP